MNEWNINGVMCGKCYSLKLAEFYPGKHERVNLSDDQNLRLFFYIYLHTNNSMQENLLLLYLLEEILYR